MKSIAVIFAILLTISALPSRAAELSPGPTVSPTCQALSGVLMKSLSRETRTQASKWWHYVAAGVWLAAEPFSGSAAVAYVTMNHSKSNNKRAEIEFAIGEVWSNKYSEHDCSLALEAIDEGAPPLKQDKPGGGIARPMATKSTLHSL